MGFIRWRWYHIKCVKRPSSLRSMDRLVMESKILLPADEQASPSAVMCGLAHSVAQCPDVSQPFKPSGVHMCHIRSNRPAAGPEGVARGQALAVPRGLRQVSRLAAGQWTP
jgi:hypothetical protein